MKIINVRKDNFTAVQTLVEDTLFENKPAAARCPGFCKGI